MTKDDIIVKVDRLLDRLEDAIDFPGMQLLYVQAEELRNAIHEELERANELNQ